MMSLFSVSLHSVLFTVSSFQVFQILWLFSNFCLQFGCFDFF